jgi:DNA-binding Lrp family transcriptional regulator
MSAILVPQPKTPARIPMDQMTKRILSRLADNVCFDVASIAKEVGAAEEVVRHRLGVLQEGGVLQGFDVRYNHGLIGQAFEFLISGTPTEATDKAAIERLCTSADVTRVFGLASTHSVAFTVVGLNAAAAQARGLALAKEAGLTKPQAILIVNTFHDRASSALPESILAPAVVA